MPDSIVRTSAEWVAYFHSNRKNLLDIPWETGAGLKSEEREIVAGSMPAWQLGESSDGRHLLAAATHYAENLRDPDFVVAVRLFIAEEQRHGAELGRFLELAGIPRKNWDWGDAMFRAFRYFLPRMEIWATPVVMVETHAMIYYAAIRRVTSSLVLRRICEQILKDEVPHIRFHCERLAILHRDRPRWLHTLTMLGHRVLFTGITLAVWTAHRRALRAGGFSFRRFWRTAWGKMGVAWKKMDPTSYSWPAMVPAVV